MNIGIDIRSLMEKNKTGVGEYIYELLSAVFKIDKQNQYFLFYNSAQDVFANIPKWNNENVHYVSKKWPNKLFNFCLFFLCWPKIDKLIGKKLDYFFAPNINFFALSPEVKQILTIHDLSFEYFPDCFDGKRRLWHKILSPKNACQRADIILTPSKNTKRDVMETYGIDEKKIKVIYPGLSSVFNEPAFAKATAGLLSQVEYSADGCGNKNNEIIKKYNLPDKFILFLGTIEPRKNIIGIIEAFNKFCGKKPDIYKLVIAGAQGWKIEPIMELISKSVNVKYIGYVDAADKPALYKLADLFVYPSLYEGFGFPVLEAMAMGTPVIAGDRSSLPEISDGSVFLVNPNNTDEIARGMEMLLSDERTKNMFSNKGIEQAKEFSWQKAATEFLKIFEN